MSDRYPHAPTCSIWAQLPRPLVPCTCGATAQQSAFEAGQREADARAMAVVEAAMDLIVSLARKESTAASEGALVVLTNRLVSQGFITKEGERRG
jgi:hypothetical protein